MFRTAQRPSVVEESSTPNADRKPIVRLLGPFRIELLDRTDITPRGRRSRAILAMLALSPRGARSRAWLQDRLWSDRGQEQGSASLRQELCEIRRHFRSLGLDILRTDREIVQLRREDIVLDLDDPEACLGDEQLLEGLDIADEEFNDWLRLERSRWDSIRAQSRPSERPAPDALSHGSAMADGPIHRAEGIRKPAANLGDPVIVLRGMRPIGSSDRARVFAQGLTEELLTALGSLQGAFVAKLDAGTEEARRCYELLGTVRDGDRLRVTAQLVCSGTAECLWSGRFDYGTEASFDAQEEISRRVVEAAQIKLRDGEIAKLWSGSSTTLAAWEHFQRGRILEAATRRETVAQACEHYSAAVSADPDFLQARISLAFCLLDQVRLGWAADRRHAVDRARRLQHEVMRCDPDHLFGRALGAFLESVEGRSGVAAKIMEGVVRDAPESPELLAYLGVLIGADGDVDREIALYERALGLTPHPPNWIRTNLALALAIRGDAGAFPLLEAALAADPVSVRAHVGMVVSHVRKGDDESGRKWARRLLALEPTFEAERWRAAECFRDKALHRRVTQDLKSAGL